MRQDATGKLWGSWKEWMKLGRTHKQHGLSVQYPAQADYMAGYRSDPTPLIVAGIDIDRVVPF